MLVIGLMSGTSLDGIDAALVEFDDGDTPQPSWRVRGFIAMPLSGAQREAIHSGIVKGNAQALCRLHADLGEAFAQAALKVCKEVGVQPSQVTVIGSHGQTLWHDPPAGGVRGATLQLGDPATIAERTGISVVSDFRTRDIAAGGEGAPLVPWVDRFLFAHDEKRRVLQNIGGIGNCTWVPRRGESAPLVAFDTGPGNALINSAVEIATDGAEAYDHDGRRAAAGRIDEQLLAELLAHPYFSRKPPKSTGRELFGKPFVEELVRRYPGMQQNWNALIATLTALTAQTIAGALEKWVMPLGVDEVVLTGGGSRNPTLVRMIEAELPDVKVSGGDVLGVDPDAKEAIAFAALAWAHVMGLPGNVPEATGAQGPRILGSLTPGAQAPLITWKN